MMFQWHKTSWEEISHPSIPEPFSCHIPDGGTAADVRAQFIPALSEVGGWWEGDAQSSGCRAGVGAGAKMGL